MPWVRCANLLEVRPFSTMLAKGDSLPFYVELRNDGNCYLSGVELTVSEVDGEDIGTMWLDFGEDNMVASEWNPLNEGVTIPDGWEGSKEVEVRVTAAYGAIVLARNGLSAQAADSSIEYLPDQRVPATLHMPGRGANLQSGGRAEVKLTPADVRVVSKSSDDGKKDPGTGEP